MGPAIAEIVPAALGLVLVNPLPILAVILLLFSPRATSTASAFVAGWVIGMLVVFALLLFVASPDPIVGSEREPSTLSSVVRVLLGLVLLYLALKQWRSRPRPGEERALPAWMVTLEQATPTKALGLGALLSGLNPKNLAFTIAAGVAIAQAELTTGETLVPVTIYV
ncbi:MAG: GAP family protein, partial [Thermomicrobiales bacterium]